MKRNSVASPMPYLKASSCCPLMEPRFMRIVLLSNRRGLTSEQVQAQAFFLSAFHPEDVEDLKASRDAGLLRGEPFELEIRALRPDGEYQWRLIQYNPLRDDYGPIVRWYAS